MRFVRLFVVLILSLFISTAAYATNLVQNYSFETVTTANVGGSSIPEVPTGWTQVTTDACAFQALQAGETPSYGGDFTIGVGGASLPTDGTRVLISDQGPPCSASIYQDVAIPAGSHPTLTVAAGVVFSSTGNGNSVASVDVTTPGGTEIANLYSRTSADGNDPLADRPSIDLSAYAGQTVRIIATATVPNTDWTGLLLDNVRLDAATPVPSMNEWGMILFALLAGIGSAYYLRRRKRFGS